MTSDREVVRPLKILVVNWLDRENPQAGGAEAHLHQIFGRLAARGHRVTLLTSGWRGCASTAELDGIRVHRCGGRHTLSLAAPRHYRRHLRDEPTDVVVEDLNKVPFFTPLWTQAPVALLVHHLFGATAFLEASPPLAAATWLLERPVPRVFRGLPTVAVSESTREDLVRRGLDRDQIEVIPNGIDLETFAPGHDGTRYDVPTVLYLGRLKRYKRVDLVLRAAAELKRRGRAFRVLVAGTGDRVGALQSLAAKLRLGSHVEFLGFVSEAHKRELLRRSWVHVLTSPKEGWGISNIEAAACGTPTVASDSPGLRESVVHGGTGFLVPHGDVIGLADTLDRVLSNPELRDRLGKAARRFAEGLSWSRSADAMEGFLNRVVGLSRHD